MLNAAGDCVASSNGNKSTSFIGTNYAEREFFKEAKEGHPGKQYAVGKITRLPGLYYSYPVFDEHSKFIGAVVSKRDVGNFFRWTHPSNAFIADSNGVIILTEDKELEFKTMPDSVVNTFCNYCQT